LVARHHTELEQAGARGRRLVAERVAVEFERDLPRAISRMCPRGIVL